MKLLRAIDEDAIKKLVQELDEPVFADREKAEKELTELGELAVASLRKFQAGALSAEQAARVKRILALATNFVLLPGERLRQFRAVAVLERIGSPDSKAILAELASGTPEARLTHEAQLSLARLKR